MNSAATPPLSAIAFAVLGGMALVVAVALALLGSFAAFGAAALGLFFVAAALIARTATTPGARVTALLSLGGIALVIVGTVATPFFYLGWALIGAGLIGAAALVSVTWRRTR